MPRRYQSRIGLLDSSPPSAAVQTEPEQDVMGYPRPQLRRSDWWSLNGVWEFQLDADGEILHPGPVDWARTIEVPFSPETSQSGVNDTGLYRACWYRRRFSAPSVHPDQRLILHFGAVDYHASVWFNGSLL